ncbi:MAG: DUF4430 domain-containing protein [Candidatus Thorarchaeota archaeon]
MIDSRILLTVALIGALVYSGAVTLLAYVAIVEQEQEPEGEGTIAVAIQILSEKPSFEYNWAGFSVVNKESSAYDALSSIANISTKDYPIGKYITAINGIEEGNGWFWFFYVWDFNQDKWILASMGTGAYKVSDGDFLRFVFEERARTSPIYSSL